MGNQNTARAQNTIPYFNKEQLVDYFSYSKSPNAKILFQNKFFRVDRLYIDEHAPWL